MKLTRKNVKLGMLISWSDCIFGVVTGIHDEVYFEAFAGKSGETWSISVLDKSGECVIIDMDETFVEVIGECLGSD